MNRDTRNIIELGVIFGICVILLNYFLAHFAVLIWPALGATSIVLAILILDSLSHLTAAPGRTFHPEPGPQSDELVRLQAVIERSLSRPETQSMLEERLRAVGLCVASARMDLPKERLCELFDISPELVDARLKDNLLVSFLSGKSTLTNAREIHELLSRIERL